MKLTTNIISEIVEGPHLPLSLYPRPCMLQLEFSLCSLQVCILHCTLNGAECSSSTFSILAVPKSAKDSNKPYIKPNE